MSNFTESHIGIPNQDEIDWINSDTKSFYNILRTSSKDLYAKGLLYSTSNASYAKVKVQMCNFAVPEYNCATKD